MVTPVVLASLLVTAAPDWCARAAVLDAVDSTSSVAAPQLDAALDAWSLEAGAVAERIRALTSHGAPLDVRLSLARLAARGACASATAERADAWSRAAAQLMRDDPRFSGMRAGDDVVDRLLHKAWLFLAGLLESEGMKQYAGNARAVYFALLVAATLWVGWRLVRAVRRRRPPPIEAAPQTHEVRAAQSRRAFASWRAQAARDLDAGEARAALRAGEAALLARLGELQPGAATPARTHREILMRLSRDAATVVAPAFATFDRCFFAEQPSLDGARRFLGAVDAAERALPQAIAQRGDGS